MWKEKQQSPRCWHEVCCPVRRAGTPAEQVVWRQLNWATSPDAIAIACELSVLWLNPKENPRPFTVKLAENPVEFLKAKTYRCPSSARPSREDNKILHFARAMAGIMVGTGAIRAIDLIRLRHDCRRSVNCQCCRIARHGSYGVRDDHLKTRLVIGR